MKLRHLIEELQKYDPELEVVMSKDSEGNGFSPYADCGTDFYLPRNTWSGELGWDEEEDDGPPEGSYEVLCLWPVN